MNTSRFVHGRDLCGERKDRSSQNRPKVAMGMDLGVTPVVWVWNRETKQNNVKTKFEFNSKWYVHP